MQNRYAGDIGDFVKLALLRALSPGFKLGVAWWLYPDEAHNDDGKHTSYLNHAKIWRHLDAELFDALREIVQTGQRSVASLEQAGLLADAVLASRPVPQEVVTAARSTARAAWFDLTLNVLAAANLVFVDPDNGLEPASFSPTQAKAGKSIALEELTALSAPGRCLVVYHHQTRRKGGHLAEIEHWGSRLRQAGFATVDALRASRGSARVFFVLDAPSVIRERAHQFAHRWHGHVSWHPDVGMTFDLTVVTPESDHIVDGTPRQHSATAATTVEASVFHRNGVDRPARRQSRRTTEIGYVNRNGQEVLAATGLAGNDHGQYVYILSCQICGHRYGANGSDIFQRRCPAHDRGATGLPMASC